MPAKCNKIKNPCKICLETVTNKTGLQCQGACKKWVHFSCLHYTPGKISDIKKGILKVTCPCPDCKTAAPKEYRTDDPLNCTNTNCPSNLPRSCISTSCPSNMIDGTKAPLQVCQKDTCKLNKATVRPPTPPNTYMPSSSSASAEFHPGPNVMGDMRSSSGEAIKVMEQICTAVGELSNQINSLMKEMKGMKSSKGNPGGYSGNANDNSCYHTTPPNKPKPCHCPGNPSP